MEKSKAEYLREWRAKNKDKDKVKAYKMKYLDNPINYEKECEYKAKYYQHQVKTNYSKVQADRRKYFEKRNRKDYFKQKCLPELLMKYYLKPKFSSPKP